MADLEPFVDIHCHLVPGIDDGSQSWDETLAMARMAVADGIGTIVVTPHQLGNFAHNHGDLIRSRTVELQQFLDRHEVPLQVLPGGDVRIEAGLVGKIRRGEVMSLADHRRHVLLELPHELYVSLDRLLSELASSSMVGILSHPERNLGILSRPAVVAPLVAAGCLMQVTAGSLLGAFGAQVQKFSESLLDDGLVHFISTDAHGPKSRRPLLRQAFDRVAKRVGLDAAKDMFCHNPSCVARGVDLASHTVTLKTPRRGGWLGWRKAG